MRFWFGGLAGQGSSADETIGSLVGPAVEYPTMYIGEQYRIVDDQAIEFIGFWRTVADEGELIIWPSQG
jgi:hypothetical protein